MLCDLGSYRKVFWEANIIVKRINLGNFQRWLPQDGYRAQLSAYIEENLIIKPQETPETVLMMYKDNQDDHGKLRKELFRDLRTSIQDQYEPSMFFDGPYLEELINKRLKAKAIAMKSARPFETFEYNTKLEAVQVPKIEPMTLFDILNPLLQYDMSQSIYNAFDRFGCHLNEIMKNAIAGNEIKQMQQNLKPIGCDPTLMTSLSTLRQMFNVLPQHKKLARLASQEIFTRPGRLPIARQDLQEYYYGDNERPKKRLRSLSPITAPSKVILTSIPVAPSPKEETVKNSKSALHNFFLPHVREKLLDPDDQFIADGSEKGQRWVLEQHKMTEDGLDRTKRYKRMLHKLTLSKEGVWEHVCLRNLVPGTDFLREDYTQLALDVLWRCNASDVEALKSQREKLNEIVKGHDSIRKEKSLGIVYDSSIALMHARIVEDPKKEASDIDEELPKTPEKASAGTNLQETFNDSSPKAVDLLSSEPDTNNVSCPTSDIFAEI